MGIHFYFLVVPAASLRVKVPLVQLEGLPPTVYLILRFWGKNREWEHIVVISFRSV